MLATLMIPFEQAYATALAHARPLPAETVPLARARHRVLAQRVYADLDMPPFDKALVDGYACRAQDLPGPLRVAGTVAAGSAPTVAIAPGVCAKIMTGAPVPEGADCVIMVEHTESAGNGAIRFIGRPGPAFIAPRGQDIRKGEALLEPGHWLQPHDVAVLAAVGCVTPKVARQPRVGVITTGDELVDAAATPGPAQIRNSNAPQLVAQLEAINALAEDRGVARDTEASLRDVIGRALQDCDVVLLSGGVSMGDFDLVPGVLRELNITLLFDKVAVQPGKPTVFGVGNGVSCFGLPGNPVSSLVIFELLVKPFLLKLQGHEYRPPNVHLPLGETFTRKTAARLAWVPVTLAPDGAVLRVEYRGSAHINAMSYADGLVAFPIGVTEMAKGQTVAVRLLRH
ncbi:MAG: gephyrin-like molybdotransferase Glp [Candidatus Hydrogenedentales bacterium]